MRKKRNLCLLFSAGLVMAARAVFAMPSNERLLNLVFTDELEEADMHTLECIAVANVYDPNKMLNAVQDQMYAACMQAMADPLTQREINSQANLQRYDLEFGMGHSISWSVDQNTIRTPEYAHWHNELDAKTNDIICKSEMMLYMKELFNKFTGLARDMYISTKLSIMRAWHADFIIDLEDRSETGNFNGTIWEADAKRETDLLYPMQSSAPAGVNVTVKVATPQAPNVRLRFSDFD